MEEFWQMDTPVEPLPLIPFAAINSDSQAPDDPVSVLYMARTDYGKDARFTLNDGPNASVLFFIPDRPLYNFTIWHLTVEDIQDNGDIIFSAETAISLDGKLLSLPLAPSIPAVVQLVFLGDLPAYGMTYMDEDGNRCCDVMELSGEDGSLVIRKANPDAGKFVLPAAG